MWFLVLDFDFGREEKSMGRVVIEVAGVLENKVRFFRATLKERGISHDDKEPSLSSWEVILEESGLPGKQGSFLSSDAERERNLP